MPTIPSPILPRGDGARPYTLIVFGPYDGPEWDVEIHHGHIGDATISNYLNTHTLRRDTHIVGDMIPYVRIALDSLATI